MLMTSFRLMVVLFFITTVVHQFLTENPKVTVILVLFSIGILSQSRWLFNQYMKIEAQFLANLRGEKKEETAAETPAERENLH